MYNIEKAATQFREKYGYSVTSPIKTESLLLELKVQTVFRQMEGEFSGMALKVDDMCFMLINSSHSIGRQNFTIFHELYHLFIQKDFTNIICNNELTPQERRIETNADIFAINLLLPREGLLKKIPDEEFKKDKISLTTILSIEQYYGSSRSALLNRLEDLSLISKEYKAALSVNVKESALANGFNTALYEPGHRNLIIGDYGIKVKNLLDNDRISKSHYLELMRDLGFDLESINKAFWGR